jgi:acetyl-CoA acetyltransferase
MAYGMGLTAEKVAENSKGRRDHQDACALANHRKAAPISAGEFLEIYTARTHARFKKWRCRMVLTR